MHITLETDYAVRIVDCLARNGIRMDAKSLSSHTGVSLRFSLKILRKLVAEKIVRSFKGTRGGYELARPACEISLGEVVEAVEGPITISRCVDASNHFQCTRIHEGDCRFNRVYSNIAQIVRDKLYQVNFEIQEKDGKE